MIEQQDIAPRRPRRAHSGAVPALGPGPTLGGAGDGEAGPTGARSGAAPDRLRGHPSHAWTGLAFVEQDPSLLELLYVRSVWRIRDGAALPSLDPEPGPDGTVAPGGATDREWAVRWQAAWAETWSWFRTRARWESDPAVLRGRGGVVPIAPHRFSDSVGRGAIDRAAFDRWVRSIPPSPWRTWEERPDRSVPAASAAAWDRGLRTIVVLPFAGAVARAMNDHCLLVSAAVRDDRALFTEALSAFG